MTSPFSFRERVTVQDKYGPAMLIEDQTEAHLYFDACVRHSMTVAQITREQAEEIERANLGYYAGYYGDDVRARVERLYRCAHPIFGPIASRGKPTPEQAFAAGYQLGRERSSGT